MKPVMIEGAALDAVDLEDALHKVHKYAGQLHADFGNMNSIKYNNLMGKLLDAMAVVEAKGV